MDTNFIDKVTVILASWLQAINDYVFRRNVVFDNYAAIRANTNANARNGKVRGYAVDGDGAEGDIYLDTSDIISADNDGTIWVDALGGRWKRKINGPVNLLWWGVSRTGSASVSSALTAANVFCRANKLGAVYVPSGDYQIATQVTWAGHVSLSGDGIYGTRFWNATGTSAIVFTESGEPFPSIRYTHHSDWGVFPATGPSGAVSPGNGFELSAAAWQYFENVGALGQAGYGLYLGDSNIACRFVRCVFKFNTLKGVFDKVHAGILQENVDVTFDHCNIEQSVDGIEINSTHLCVDTCTIEANTGVDIIVNKPARVVNNYIEKIVGGTIGTRKKMVLVASGAYGATIIGNRFLMNNQVYLDGIDYAAHAIYGDNFFFNINSAGGARSVYFSGGAYTASLFPANNDYQGADFGIDRPIGVSSTLGLVLPNGGESYALPGDPGLKYYRGSIPFTPMSLGSTSAGTGTYTYQTGFATRNGDRVMGEASLFWTAHTGTGNLIIELVGLPVSAASSTPLSPVALYFSSLAGTAGRQILGYIQPGTNRVLIEQADVTGGVATTAVPIENGTVIVSVSFNYRVTT